MFHKAIELQLKEGTKLELKFLDGTVKEYDIVSLFSKYPQMKALQNRDLFLKGHLQGYYGIVWNDDLDLEAETVYEEGITIRRDEIPITIKVGTQLSEARAKGGLSQKELSKLTGIDQSDISKIELGKANPSIGLLHRLAQGMGMELKICFVKQNSKQNKGNSKHD